MQSRIEDVYTPIWQKILRRGLRGLLGGIVLAALIFLPGFLPADLMPNNSPVLSAFMAAGQGFTGLVSSLPPEIAILAQAGIMLAVGVVVALTVIMGFFFKERLSSPPSIAKQESVNHLDSDKEDGHTPESLSELRRSGSLGNNNNGLASQPETDITEKMENFSNYFGPTTDSSRSKNSPNTTYSQSNLQGNSNKNLPAIEEEIEKLAKKCTNPEMQKLFIIFNAWANEMEKIMSDKPKDYVPTKQEENQVAQLEAQYEQSLEEFSNKTNDPLAKKLAAQMTIENLQPEKIDQLKLPQYYNDFGKNDKLIDDTKKAYENSTYISDFKKLFEQGKIVIEKAKEYQNALKALDKNNDYKKLVRLKKALDNVINVKNDVLDMYANQLANKGNDKKERNEEDSNRINQLINETTQQLRDKQAELSKIVESIKELKEEKSNSVKLPEEKQKFKKAFLKFSQKYHPDKHDTDSSNKDKKIAEYFFTLGSDLNSVLNDIENADNINEKEKEFKQTYQNFDNQYLAVGKILADIEAEEKKQKQEAEATTASASTSNGGGMNDLFEPKEEVKVRQVRLETPSSTSNAATKQQSDESVKRSIPQPKEKRTEKEKVHVSKNAAQDTRTNNDSSSSKGVYSSETTSGKNYKVPLARTRYGRSYAADAFNETTKKNKAEEYYQSFLNTAGSTLSEATTTTVPAREEAAAKFN